MITFCPLLILAPSAMSREALLFNVVVAEAWGMENTSFKYAWAIEEAVTAARHMAASGEHTSAEHHILKMFHEYNLTEGFAYDLVSRMYSALGDSFRSELWLNNKARFLQPAETFAVRD